jgi:multidrug efflux system membrane fusion protein
MTRIVPIVVLLIAGCANKAAPRSAPVPVEVAPVVRGPVPLELQATGTVEATKTAVVEPQVNGMITRVEFHEGQEVTQGQVLFLIDSRPYAAALAQAQAMVARDRATAVNAKAEADRYSGLVAKEYVTRQQYDQVRATAAAAEATRSASQAAVEQARLNLQYATVRAPIAGRTGSLMVREGNLLRAGGPMPMVTINQIRPILVRFAVPASNLRSIQRYRAQGKLPVQVVPTTAATAFAEQGPSGLLGDTGGTDPVKNKPAAPVNKADIADGTLTFIDNTVDSATGTILLKGTFANTAGTLWPGEFVNVRLQLTVETALTVPSSALVSGQDGSYVFVIAQDGTAQQRKVVVDRSRGDRAVLHGELQPGERVVTDGQLRLRSGSKVQIKGGAGGNAGAQASQ